MKANQQHLKKIGSYVLEKVIGTGVFGSVYIGRSSKPNLKQLTLAIKQIPKKNLSKHQIERFEQEKLNLINLGSYPNIVPLYDIIITNNNYYLVMQYCEGGDLRSFLQIHKQIPEQQLQYWAAQIAIGLQAMHSQNIVHRDIKPENILLSEPTHKANLFLADLGLSVKLEQDQLAMTICGTPLYSAPEVLGGIQYDYKADIWSFGSIMYELLVGIPPFNARTVKQLKLMMMQGIQGFFNVNVSEECQNLIKSMLKYNTEERINIKQFLQNPWVQKGIQMQEQEFELVMSAELMKQQQKLENFAETDQNEEAELSSNLEYAINEQQVYKNREASDQHVFFQIQKLKAIIDKANLRQGALFEQICKGDNLESLSISLFTSKELQKEINKNIVFLKEQQTLIQKENPLLNELNITLKEAYKIYMEFLSLCQDIQQSVFPEIK